MFSEILMGRKRVLIETLTVRGSPNGTCVRHGGAAARSPRLGNPARHDVDQRVLFTIEVYAKRLAKII